MRGVYFSQNPRFVAWAIAKNSDLADTLTQSIHHIRQSTLHADLIPGALSDSSTLIIIGRERQSPLHQLPPLQTESILLLASTTGKEPSQSPGINHLMARKTVSGRDRCPTCLSRQPANTGPGHPITLTDILPKDSSESGTIYESHYRYPEPGHYPFDRPLFRKLGLNELVYNWNTAAAIYAIDCEGYTIYTLGRTGSLPVSYFNSQQRSQSIGYRYENQAYHYFATLGCTDLARVVQYTALYQLFIDNNISYSGNTYPSFPKNKPFLLYKPTTDLLDTLKNLADSLAQRSFHTYLRAHRVNQLMREVGKNNLDLLGMDLANVKNWYAANLKNKAGRYLKTPSLIVTYNDMLTTGGHNLSSRISRVNSMTNYKHSRNYTPTDYQRPATTGPVTAKTTHTAKKQPGAQPARRPGSNSPAQSRNKAAVRPRSSVISPTPRSKRGL